MRINKYIALHSELSRRRADEAVLDGRVKINGVKAELGSNVSSGDLVLLDGTPVGDKKPQTTIILLNKPVGYVCSRTGQGSKTIYNLLPENYKNLKPAGRLDKDSAGLLLMTNKGDLLQDLTHPSKNKIKIYEVIINKPLSNEDENRLNSGVKLHDGVSNLKVFPLSKDRFEWQIKMSEGKNRQIRRTFSEIGYEVVSLIRTQFDEYKLDGLAPGAVRIIK